MKERIYFKSDKAYAKEVHEFWVHILHHLSNVSIIEENENYIRFSTTEDTNKHLQFLANCDFGPLFDEPLDELK